MFSQLGDDADDSPLYFEKGRTTLSREEAMQLMEHRSFAVGLLDKSVDRCHVSGDHLSSKEWGTLLESEKTRHPEERTAHVPLLPAKTVETWYEEGSPTKDVYPIDSSYLLKSFQPKDTTVI